ncbi:MAG: hypothetical protein AAF563_09590 [Pseudomonadota bacterium]
MSFRSLRQAMMLSVVAVVLPCLAHAQFADETQSLFGVSPSTVDRTTNQVIIEFKEEKIVEEISVEESEEGICCQLPEEERAASDACLNVTCPESP